MSILDLCPDILELVGENVATLRGKAQHNANMRAVCDEMERIKQDETEQLGLYDPGMYGLAFGLNGCDFGPFATGEKEDFETDREVRKMWESEGGIPDGCVYKWNFGREGKERFGGPGGEWEWL